MSNIVRFLNASHLFIFSKSNFIITNNLYLKMTNYIISFNESTDVTVFNKTYGLIKFARQEKIRILSFKLENETILSSWMEWSKQYFLYFFCGLILFLGVQIMFFCFCIYTGIKICKGKTTRLNRMENNRRRRIVKNSRLTYTSRV